MLYSAQERICILLSQLFAISIHKSEASCHFIAAAFSNASSHLV
ncbi:MAG: hypothetical protein PUB45_00730 [Bacteroidales bacterium]|nr:hypothetical protein [Bacteroidales bacterium]